MTRQFSLLSGLICAAALALSACASAPVPAVSDGPAAKIETRAPKFAAQSPVARHGALSVSGAKIVGSHGRPVSLAGPSFFWSNTGWGQEDLYTKESVEYFARDWDAGIIRAAIAGENQGSYLTEPEANYARAQTLIDAAIANGLYIVVDWHTHHAEDHVEEAKDFFTRIATQYGETPNVIYEIYNEPLDTTDWAKTVKPYAQELIQTIRAIDPDNIIVVGTQSWSQRVDKAADDPIAGHSNIAYALHFYAASHKGDLRAKAQYAIDKGLPIMVTEWGSVDYDGDGAVDARSTLEWMEFIKANDLSHMVWSVSDKDEGAAIFRLGTSNDGNWTDDDLSASGRVAKAIIANW